LAFIAKHWFPLIPDTPVECTVFQLMRPICKIFNNRKSWGAIYQNNPKRREEKLALYHGNASIDLYLPNNCPETN